MKQSYFTFLSSQWGKFSIYLRANGDQESIRRALRTACRGRRSIVFLQFDVYIGNVIKSLLSKSVDILEIVPDNIMRNHFDIRYELWIDPHGDIPMFLFEIPDQPSVAMPLFKFIGIEGRSGGKIGRPLSPHAARGKSAVPDYIDPVTHAAVFLPKGALTPDEFKLLLKLREKQSVTSLSWGEATKWQELQEKIGEPIPTEPKMMSRAERERFSELESKKMAGRRLSEMEEFEYNKLMGRNQTWQQWKNPQDHPVIDNEPDEPRKSVRKVRKLGKRS